MFILFIEIRSLPSTGTTATQTTNIPTTKAVYTNGCPEMSFPVQPTITNAQSRVRCLKGIMGQSWEREWGGSSDRKKEKKKQAKGEQKRIVVKEGFKLSQLTVRNYWKFAETWAFEHVFITMIWRPRPCSPFSYPTIILDWKLIWSHWHINKILIDLDISFRFCIAHSHNYLNKHTHVAFLRSSPFYSHFF